MENILSQLPDKIKKHLNALIESSGLPNNEESLELIAQNWVNKKEMFASQISNLHMKEIENLNVDDKRPALLLTYSGSLIGLGPDKGGRWLEYASIQLRKDVPGIVMVENTNIADTIAVDKGAAFSGGAVKSTSALFKISVCSEDVDLGEQEKRVREAMIFLTNGFVKLNRQSLPLDKNAPDQFNMKSMINYVASKNNVTQKQAKNILHDYLALVETGMLLNERVSLGRIGNLSLKLREAQKPRVIINPHTGEEITIEAKPKMYVPKIRFSRYLKERAASQKTE